MTESWYGDNDSDDEGQDEQDSGSNNPLRDARNQLKAERKSRRELQKQLEELKPLAEEFKARKQIEGALSVFKEIGLDERHAKAFTQLNPETEATEANVIEWAVGFGLVEESDDENDDTSTQEVETRGFAPTPTSGQPIGGKLLSREEWRDMQREDPQAAVRAFREGRVDTKHLLPEDSGRVSGGLPKTADDFRRQNKQNA